MIEQVNVSMFARDPVLDVLGRFVAWDAYVYAQNIIDDSVHISIENGVDMDLYEALQDEVDL